jgi:hypothetical protein
MTWGCPEIDTGQTLAAEEALTQPPVRMRIWQKAKEMRPLDYRSTATQLTNFGERTTMCRRLITLPPRAVGKESIRVNARSEPQAVSA